MSITSVPWRLLSLPLLQEGLELPGAPQLGQWEPPGGLEQGDPVTRRLSSGRYRDRQQMAMLGLTLGELSLVGDGL